MINKRLLIKSLLAHTNENSFYDNKRYIPLTEKEGKAKFLKHVCALANSNPENNAYIIIGVEDTTKEIVGVDFFDDSKIQNLVDAYLINPPIICYENIPFADLPPAKVVGLVTIKSIGKVCSLKKNIWKYYTGMVFFRKGSMSVPKVFDIVLKSTNKQEVEKIEHYAKNNIERTLNGVIYFINEKHKNLDTDYRVFKEQFVVCWAGKKKVVNGKVYFKRMDIELINEQVRLFYSALDEVSIDFNKDHFTITEYIKLGIYQKKKYYPLETLTLTFSNNGSYTMRSTIIFNPPQYPRETLEKVYKSNREILLKIEQGIDLSKKEQIILKNLPASYLICALHGFAMAKEILESHRALLKKYNSSVYTSLKEALRILRKLKYS